MFKSTFIAGHNDSVYKFITRFQPISYEPADPPALSRAKSISQFLNAGPVRFCIFCRVFLELLSFWWNCFDEFFGIVLSIFIKQANIGTFTEVLSN